MQIYLVGGAVRDQLLGLSIHERDWVVVGASPEEMFAQDYQQVGKDFPVFIHPKTGEEYALARTERKTGKGYTGFSCNAALDVSLEDDLKRRDFTINAMAKTSEGEIIDPFNGQSDLKQGIIRHVSPAFVEDPLRVLRAARFAARFNFKIAEETQVLLLEIVENGELNDLVPERVWKEVEKALATDKPQLFIEKLRDCQALQVIFPEIDHLFGVPNPSEAHPEIDSGVHSLLALEQAAKLSDEKAVRFAALLHDVGKALTPEEKWPHHDGHEAEGVPLIEALCQKYRVPRDYCDLAILVCRHHLFVHDCMKLTTKKLLDLLEALDAFRRPQRFKHVLLACEADMRGRKGYDNCDYPQKEYLQHIFQMANDIDVQAIIATGVEGSAIKEALRQERIRVLKEYVTP